MSSCRDDSLSPLPARVRRSQRDPPRRNRGLRPEVPGPRGRSRAGTGGSAECVRRAGRAPCRHLRLFYDGHSPRSVPARRAEPWYLCRIPAPRRRKPAGGLSCGVYVPYHIPPCHDIVLMAQCICTHGPVHLCPWPSTFVPMTSRIRTHDLAYLYHNPAFLSGRRISVRCFTASGIRLFCG